ncbi:hypothetical protein BKA58DRAFT_233290 [Alternaria rosae]|uniref:uncharacterized protein n=1 Tax=Alternaria rosae TaxID=1187941 RepID=UPI001E8EE4AF|nr:uncharacterized protein BKA58DRAFT_233290 [Alternaria rosae]KAH6864802.1 hypothetical protein BKA58DRAFT_233290 [Alternaria rosae]
MAEPVSSIITIATVGLALVRACKNYIEAVREIDDLVDRLLEKITELHGVVRLLNSQYHQAEPDGNSEPSILVREKIALCRDRLREIKRKIADLGPQSKSAETFLDKASVKRRMDAVAKDIEFAVDDIRRYLGDIVLVTGACSYLEVSSYIRRVSESSVPQPIRYASKEDQPAQNDLVSLDRWFSNTDTISDPVHLRRASNPTLPPRLSVSSSSSSALLTQSDDDESILSKEISDISKPGEDWKVFHRKVVQCKDDPALVTEIRSMLEQHPEPVTLVNILGDHQRAPLHLAAQRGYVNLARILLVFGADINAQDTEPASVLDHAVAHNQVDFITVILDMGADESALLERNRNQLEHKKAVIALRKARQQSPTTEKARKFSWSLGRKRTS